MPAVDGASGGGCDKGGEGDEEGSSAHIDNKDMWCKRDAIDRASRRERSKDRKKVEEAERLLRVAGRRGADAEGSKQRKSCYGERKSGSGAGVLILFESWWREDAWKELMGSWVSRDYWA